MANIFRDGAEGGDLLRLSSYDAECTVASDQARTGTYSYKVTGGNKSGKKAFTAISEGYLELGWRINNNTKSGKVFVWYKGTTELGSVRINYVSSRFELYTGTGTLVATGSAVNWAKDTWYGLEVYIKIHDSTGVITLKVDTVQDATFTGDTKPGSDTTFDTVAYYNADSTPASWFDDLGLNDTAGGADNSWIGATKMMKIKANAAGDVTQFTPSAGNNYECVDDIPSDGDTTYVESSTVGHQDLYNLEACGLSNVTIHRVFPEARARDTATGGSIYLLVKPSGGSIDPSPARSLISSYAVYLGDDLTLNPADSAAWEVADIDALQVGEEVVS